MYWASEEERRQLGRARRKQVGRHGHDQVKVKARPAAAQELVAQSMQGRVPALAELKYKLMMESPFGYFRGAAPVMAADLAVLPNTGILAQLCGDAHVRNLGAYAAPDGKLVFDINDFDESIQGPFEWDLKRMAASLVLAGREAASKDGAMQKAVGACLECYGARMRDYAKMTFLEVGRAQVHRLQAVTPVHKALLQAERATPQHTLEQLTEPAGRGTRARRFKDTPPMLTRVTGRPAAEVMRALTPYRAVLEPQRQRLLALYRPVDVAFKVVGTGSVGLRDYCIYLEGNGPMDPLFLQIKEEVASAYAPWLQDAHPAVHNGQRVAEGQRAMQMQSDPFLGWTHMGRRQFLVRQLSDHKGSIDVKDLTAGGLAAYGEVCGELLARGHARSGDPAVIAGYLGSGKAFVKAVTAFGFAYAEQITLDWNEMCASRGTQSRPAAKKGKKS